MYKSVTGVAVAALLAVTTVIAPASATGQRPAATPVTGPAATVPKGYTVLATPRGVISGYASPGGRKVKNVSPTWEGERISMPVRAIRNGYYDVRLPGRPNGSTIWVKQSEVITGATPYQIIVNLATTHVKLMYRGNTIINVPAGVGTRMNPTPKGRFFVAFYAQAPNAGYGPFVMVTSAHSNTITDWQFSGDALVAIHGPLGAGRTIGHTGARISHGCIRLHVADQLRFRNVPVGTPVLVVF